MADKIAVMRTGKLVQLGSPREVFARPANTFVANFIGSTPMNLLDGVVATAERNSAGVVSVNAGPEESGAVATSRKRRRRSSAYWVSSTTSPAVVELAGGRLPAATGSVPTGAKVTVGIRPEYLNLSTGDATGPSIRGTVVVAENLGTSSLVSVNCDGTADAYGIAPMRSWSPKPRARTSTAS